MAAWFNEVMYWMRGRLPGTVCQLTKVAFIDVSENMLKKLPGCMNKNEALVELRASNNRIKKPPPKLADAPNVVKVLKLSAQLKRNRNKTA